MEKKKQKITKRPAGLVIPVPAPRPTTSDDPSLKLFREAKEQLSPAKSTSPTEAVSPAQDASLASPASLAPDASLANETPQALQNASLAPPASHATSASLASHAIHLWGAIKEPSTGWTKVFGDIFNHLLRQLTPYEQAAYMQLYYLAWGRGNDSCKISYPTLAKRAGLKDRSTFTAVQGLISKGLIEKIDLDIGKGKEQGNHFRVVLPASLARLASHARGASLAPDASYKEKDIKSNNKEGAAPDYKSCPDCQGSGFWYPEGVEKGVAKCKHERMGK